MTTLSNALLSALSCISPCLAPLLAGLSACASLAWHAAAGWAAQHVGCLGVGGLLAGMGWFRALVRAIDR